MIAVIYLPKPTQISLLLVHVRYLLAESSQVLRRREKTEDMRWRWVWAVKAGHQARWRLSTPFTAASCSWLRNYGRPKVAILYFADLIRSLLTVCHATSH